MRSSLTRSGRLLATAVMALVLAATGCQVKLDVRAKVTPDGSGAVTVGVGLDGEALAKVGDLKAQLRVDDLKAAGWQISGPSKEGDGFTWIRAEKGFADPAAATRVMNEVNGPDGAFRNWIVARSSSLLSTSYSVKGTVDLTKGMQTFGDAQLSKVFGGDPFAAAVAKLEKEQGRPLADMVQVRVTVQTPGGSRSFTPSLADTKPLALDASSSTSDLLRLILAVLAALTVVMGVTVVGLRRRALRIQRERRARYSSLRR